MFAETLPMFYTIGTAPYHLAGRPRDTPIIASAFATNQEAPQYTLRVVPGGLSLIGIFIKIAALSLFALDHKELVEADDGTDVVLVGEQITDYSLCPLNLTPW